MSDVPQPDKPSNGLIKYTDDSTNQTADNLNPAEFLAVAWRLEAMGARLMARPFELYSGGRWHAGGVGDWVIMGARGELAIVAGVNFPGVLAVQATHMRSGN